VRLDPTTTTSFQPLAFNNLKDEVEQIKTPQRRWWAGRRDYVLYSPLRMGGNERKIPGVRGFGEKKRTRGEEVGGLQGEAIGEALGGDKVYLTLEMMASVNCEVEPFPPKSPVMALPSAMVCACGANKCIQHTDPAISITPSASRDSRQRWPFQCCRRIRTSSCASTSSSRTTTRRSGWPIPFRRYQVRNRERPRRWKRPFQCYPMASDRDLR